MAIEENWSVRELRHNVKRMVYERTLSNQRPKQPSEILHAGSFHSDMVLKDPYVLDFLDLPAEHCESELEEAILRDIEKFILELGTGFSFIARQKRISLDGDHFYLDLLFYNRKLKRLVAIELKAGKFQAAYKGQMELYLKYLDKYECFENELSPIGIILCTEKSEHQIELLDLQSSGIHVAEYWTELPPREILEKKLQEFLQKSTEKLKLEN